MSVLLRSAALLAALVMCQCASAPAKLDTCPSGRTAKGVELYSWQTANGEWTFAMLHGTNRLKTTTEIRQSGCRLNERELVAAMSRIEKGESLFWGRNPEGGLLYPPPEVIERLQRYAKRARLVLTVFQDPVE